MTTIYFCSCRYQNYRVVEKESRRNRSSKLYKAGGAIEVPSVPANVKSEKKEEAPEHDDFFYYPSSVEIPDIDIPEQLPDLPGKLFIICT